MKRRRFEKNLLTGTPTDTATATPTAAMLRKHWISQKTYYRLANTLREFRRALWPKPHMRKLTWERMEDALIERVEPACVQLDDQLYNLAGYRTLDEVAQDIEVLNLRTGTWSDPIPLPDYIPQTHQGVVAENHRYIYHTAGQLGVQCSHAVDQCYGLDTHTHQWSTLPRLPEIRYAAAARLWNGRLHVVGGSKEDRVTPATEHWSLAVKNGQAVDNNWREEAPLPRGGPHRCSAIVDNQLFILGGQEGDRPRVPGDPRCTCDWTYKMENFYSGQLRLESGRG